MTITASALVRLRVRIRGVLEEVFQERLRQVKKWGDPLRPDGTSRAQFLEKANEARRRCNEAEARGECSWRHILLEEVYEALAEEDPEKIRYELIQVTAVGCQWIEDIDKRRSHGS